MKIAELSNEFDILYNQVNSNQAANIDEYEKSVFLTRAQDDIVKAYFDPRGNKFLEGFDDGQKRQYDLSSLVKNQPLQGGSPQLQKYDPRSFVYVFPEDLFLTLNESILEEKDGIKYIYQIIPIAYSQYHVLMQKPYQYPTKRSVWRLITGQVNNRTYCEIIGRFKNSDQPVYMMRYVKKLTPIILVDLDTEYDGLTIDGYHGNQDQDGDIADPDGGIQCKLPEGIHHEIVQRAVELATAVYNPQALGTIAGVGNVSATNLGIVPRQESK